MKIENFEKVTELMAIRKNSIKLLDDLNGNFMNVTVYNNQRHVTDTDVKGSLLESKNMFINEASNYVETLKSIVKEKIENLEIEIAQL